MMKDVETSGHPCITPKNAKKRKERMSLSARTKKYNASRQLSLPILSIAMRQTVFIQRCKVVRKAA